MMQEVRARRVHEKREPRRYGHDSDKFSEFERRYKAELREPERAEAVRHLAEKARTGPVTLLTGTGDLEQSQAQVLVRILRAGRSR